MKTRRSSETGQILIILTVVIVVLLGMVALAVDGGMVYSDRRLAQNSADSAALAGASAALKILENPAAKITWDTFTCSDSNVLTALTAAEGAAISRAASNQFVIDASLEDGHGVSAFCDSVNVGGWLDKYIDVKVMITHTTETSFAQMVFGGELINTVEAVVRLRPRSSLAYDYAIVSLGDDCGAKTGGITIEGTSSTHINGGGIFSNSCIDQNGNIDVLVNPSDRGIRYVTTYSAHGASGEIQPTPTKASAPLRKWTIDEPLCAALPDRGTVKNGGTIQPGRYDGITVNNNEVLKMQPGLYCLYGFFKENGHGTIQVDSSGTCVSYGVDGVTIVMMERDFDVTGTAEINLQASLSSAVSLNGVQPPAMCSVIPGMLLYMPESNDGQVYLRGNEDSTFRGTIYAPNGIIDLGGTSSTIPTLNTQVIGRKVTLHGTSNININFNGAENYTRPAMLDMLK